MDIDCFGSIGKRGQITMFIILGVVVLISFVLLFTLYVPEFEESVDVTGSDLNSDLSSSAQSCLDDSFVSTLRSIGKQGLYYSPSEFIEFDSHVPYFIDIDKTRSVPDYPCNDNVKCAFRNDGNFTSYTFGTNAVIEELFVETEIEKYLSDLMLTCINNRVISGKPVVLKEYRFRVEVEDKSSRVLADLVFDMSGVLQSFSLSSVQNVNMRLMINAINEVIRLDNLYLDYDMFYDSSSGLGFNGKKLLITSLNPIIEVIPVADGDVVKFTDTTSNLVGEHYDVWFARRNRAPVLDFIDDGLVKLGPGQSVTFELIGNDPDEDKLEYGYVLNDGASTSCKSCLIDPGKGQHVLRFYVSDGELFDYQDINVLDEG